jgi:hypothetical protein
MASRCRTCQRVNPADAAYCYHDGTPLDGGAAAAHPRAAGGQAFGHPLYLPSGRWCRTFDELALALQDDWKGALELLKQGYLEGFLSGVGRADLAQAARAAGKFPDPDRGLDEFLAKLPGTALQPPRLAVLPQEINLGTLAVGGQRRFALRLQNQGMRLLYGTVTCPDTPWLAVGDPPGAAEKRFHFRDEQVLPVLVQGDRLRASPQGLEGRLTVASNAGSVTVVVRASIPVKPFPEGVLAGATSPRQLARQAKARPKEAAVLFQGGKVAAWYKANGWSYPIQGPSASGLGAVQQFFEALGLVVPPAVEINTQAVNFLGNPGDQLEYMLEVNAKEPRPVYAHASSDKAWLQAGPAQLRGRTARIPLRIPAVPDRPGDTLFARVLVSANGNQRFEVNVGLAIGAADGYPAAIPVLDVVEIEPAGEVLEAIPLMEVVEVERPASHHVPPPRRRRR